MSSLTVDMGMARRTDTYNPNIPEQLASRNDMTLAQKQRLSVLAKMGVGPIADSMPMSMGDGKMPPLPGGGLPMRDRKTEMMEKERKARQAEEADEADREQEMFSGKKPVKKARTTIGMPRLGMVMPREENIPQVPPQPLQVPEPKQWTLKISSATAERAAKSSGAGDSTPSVAPVPADPTDPEEERKEREREMQVMMLIHKERARRQAAAKAERDRAEAALPPAPPLPQAKPKAAKKKKKRKNRELGVNPEEWDQEWAEGESGDEDVEEDPNRLPGTFAPRDKGPQMIVESVKGKVTNANKNLTDADLERRFATLDSAGGGSLMTEEQVLSIIRREKQERGGGGPIERGGASASRRVQRELEEWADKKAQQRARVKSPHRFERMVIARK